MLIIMSIETDFLKEKTEMTLKEFAEGRGIDYSTLMQWLWRHPELRQQMEKPSGADQRELVQQCN